MRPNKTRPRIFVTQPVSEHALKRLRAVVSVKVFADLHADVGEAPHWDEQSKTLLFVDLTGGAVFRYDHSGVKLSSFSVGQEVGAAVPRRVGFSARGWRPASVEAPSRDSRSSLPTWRDDRREKPLRERRRHPGVLTGDDHCRMVPSGVLQLDVAGQQLTAECLG